MAQSRRTRHWYNRHLVSWLLLPFVSWGIWVATGWMTNWVLSHSYRSTHQLQTSFYPQALFSQTLTITSIQARVDRNSDIAEITLTTTNSALKHMEFKFPYTEIPALEIALAQELNSTPAAIQSLIYYQFN